MTDNRFINNQEQTRYELHVNDKIAIANYKVVENTVCITHVETPPELQGQGIASQLVEKVLEDIQQQNKKVAPFCRFAIGYIQKHPQWQSLLCDDRKIV